MVDWGFCGLFTGGPTLPKHTNLKVNIEDQNTQNLEPDPDPELWPNLYPDPGLCYLF